MISITLGDQAAYHAALKSSMPSAAATSVLTLDAGTEQGKPVVAIAFQVATEAKHHVAMQVFTLRELFLLFSALVGRYGFGDAAPVNFEGQGVATARLLIAPGGDESVTGNKGGTISLSQAWWVGLRLCAQHYRVCDADALELALRLLDIHYRATSRGGHVVAHHGDGTLQTLVVNGRGMPSNEEHPFADCSRGTRVFTPAGAIQLSVESQREMVVCAPDRVDAIAVEAAANGRMPTGTCRVWAVDGASDPCPGGGDRRHWRVVS